MPSLPPLGFWLILALMAGLALAFVLPQLLSGRVARRGGSRRVLNAEVHRSQLDDLSRERDEGTLSQADYERARADVERRLLDEPLAADEHSHAGATRRTAWIVAVVLPFAAVALYFTFGTPSALAPSASVSASDDPAGFRETLARHLARNPADARSWVLLARAEMDAERFGEAANAYQKAIGASSKVARDPEVLCELADALGMMNGGSLEGRPSELIASALAIDPHHARALEMAGSAAYADGNFAAAADAWRRLLVQLAPSSREHLELAAAIDRAERRARVSLPPAATHREKR